MPTEASIGSSSLYISSSSSVSADLGPAGATAEILFGAALTTASFTPFCSLSFSFEAISGFYTSEGFLRPGLNLDGVAVVEALEIVDLFIGSYTDYLAVPRRLVRFLWTASTVAAAVVGRFIPLD